MKKYLYISRCFYGIIDVLHINRRINAGWVLENVGLIRVEPKNFSINSNYTDTFSYLQNSYSYSIPDFFGFSCRGIFSSVQWLNQSNKTRKIWFDTELSEIFSWRIYPVLDTIAKCINNSKKSKVHLSLVCKSLNQIQ